MQKIKNKIYKFLYDNDILFIYYFIIYLRRFFFLKKKLNLIDKKKKYKVIGKKNCDYFLGYYDINNFSDNVKKILFHSKKINEKKINICLFDILSNTVRKLDETIVWSWQLGSRLQWLNDQRVIFNSIDSNKNLCSFLINLKSGEKRQIKYPIFSISKNYKYSLDLNFQRLENCRPGYGYNFLDKEFNDKNFIRLINLNENKLIKIFDQNFFKDKLKNQIFDNYYFNHLSWSPNNENFIVYLICTKSRENKLIYFTDLNNCMIIPHLKNICHHEWIDNDNIFFYGEINNSKNFFTYNLKNFEFKKLNFTNSNLDGHPHTIDGNNFIIDTYVNKFHERKLYTYDLKFGYSKDILTAFSNPRLFGSKKCDLHPKISKKNNMIAFDTSHNNKREFVILM